MAVKLEISRCNLRARAAWPVNRLNTDFSIEVEVHGCPDEDGSGFFPQTPDFEKASMKKRGGPAKAGFLLRTHSHSKQGRAIF